MRTPTAAEIVAAAHRVVAERDDLLELLARVSDAVLDKAPDGMSVAYLPVDLLDEIRRRIH
jgi:hypothetical protein